MCYNEGWKLAKTEPIIITRLRGAVIVPIRRTEGTGNGHEMEEGVGRRGTALCG